MKGAAANRSAPNSFGRGHWCRRAERRTPAARIGATCNIIFVHQHKYRHMEMLRRRKVEERKMDGEREVEEEQLMEWK